MDDKDWIILAKYLNNELSREDYREFEGSEHIHEEMKKEVLHWWPQRLEVPGVHISPEEKDDAWNQISSTLNSDIPADETTFEGWILKVAAAVILLLGIYSLWPSENIVKTTKDQKSEVLLSDGSKVFLNQSSSLKYGKSFGEKMRNVQLIGEAFFQVQENSELPFVIRTGGALITVLGTSFNVLSTEASDRIEVTVITGEVLFSHEDMQEIITPGEMGVFDKKSQRFYKVSLDEFNALAWHSGKLEFTSTSFREIETTLERVFGVDITVNNPRIYDCSVTSVIHFDELAEVLEVLQLTMGFTYEILHDQIQISGNGCE